MKVIFCIESIYSTRVKECNDRLMSFPSGCRHFEEYWRNVLGRSEAGSFQKNSRRKFLSVQHWYEQSRLSEQQNHTDDHTYIQQNWKRPLLRMMRCNQMNDCSPSNAGGFLAHNAHRKVSLSKEPDQTTKFRMHEQSTRFPAELRTVFVVDHPLYAVLLHYSILECNWINGVKKGGQRLNYSSSLMKKGRNTGQVWRRSEEKGKFLSDHWNRLKNFSAHLRWNLRIHVQ